MLLKLVLAAMNYTVVVEDATKKLDPPTFSSQCDPFKGLKCRCDSNKSPWNYFNDADGLTQLVTIPTLNASTYEIEYIYHTGVCFEVSGSENFLTSSGDTTIVPDENCFPSSTFVLSDSIPQKNITVYLFESYPQQKQYSSTTADQLLVDYNVSQAVITMYDTVSAFPYTDYNYNESLFLMPPSRALKPVGFNYTIVKNQPLVISPFTLSITITVNRYGSDGPSTASNTWYIPVLGIIANPLANFYPIASDPTLIFLVLRVSSF